MRTVYAVIPVYNPEPVLISTCNALRGHCRVLVVDDGSTERTEIFHDLPDDVTLVHHAENMGKGRAIRTAIEWIRNHAAGTEAVVFADGDGQHLPDDILAVAGKCLELGQVVLGTRDFSGAEIPFRSRFGNVITSWLVRQLFGFAIYDTQTGLRAIPSRLFGMMSEIPGDRYEYEMRLFGALFVRREPLTQTSISIVYIDGNRSSHFRPLMDSVMIYRGLFDDALGVWRSRLALFVLSSLTSFIVDVGCFWVMFDTVMGENAFGRLWWSVAVARTISLSCNFLFNRYVVFRSSEMVSFGRSLWRYLVLAMTIMLMSYAITDMLVFILRIKNVIGAKIVVDAFLFVVSYIVQRGLVFR